MDVGIDVVAQPASYGLELIDILTGRPIIGTSAVVETTTDLQPYLVNESRWVFTGLPSGTANFVVTAQLYVTQTVTTGISLPDPAPDGPGYLATIQMVPRIGYPFSPTLTRLTGLVRLGAEGPPVANATVTLTPRHYHSDPANPPPTTVNDANITVTTTEDGQYTAWFLSKANVNPPIANQVTIVQAVSGARSAAALPIDLNLNSNGVTNAPTLILT